MKILLIAIGVLTLFLFVAVCVCAQAFRALRSTKRKLDAANDEISALKKHIETQKKISEVMNHEEREADRDKQNLHSGTNADKFNAANERLHEHKD